LLDEDANPAAAPHVPRLPVRERFGDPGSGGYRDRIATVQTRTLCVPQPALRVRRSVELFATPPPPLPVQAAEAVAHCMVVGAAVSPQGVRFDNFDLYGDELPGWRLSTRVLLQDSGPQHALSCIAPGATTAAPRAARIVVSRWRAEDRASTIRIDSLEFPDAGAARRALPQILAEIELPNLQPWERDGDASVRSPNGTLALFARGNHVHILRSVGPEVVDVTKEADALDVWLMNAGNPEESPIGTLAASIAPSWRRTLEPSHRRAGAAFATRGAAGPRRFVVTALSGRR
jgi:hypothetical protein